MARRLVLASTSPWRRALMERLGLPFETAAPDFVEEAPDDVDPVIVAERFAVGKAESLAAKYPDALIIGSDQVLETDGARLCKPANLAEAAAQLRRLSGRTHVLHTAVAVHDPAARRTVVDLARVDLTMRDLTEAQIGAYVRREQPIGSVGGYTFEGRGIALFEAVVGPDESAIVGLPLLGVCRLLRDLGVEPLDG